MAAQKKIDNLFYNLRLPKKIDDKTIANLVTPDLLESYIEVHFDFSMTEIVERSFYQSLYRFKRELSLKNIELKSFNISKSVQAQFHDHGTDSFFNIVKKDNSKLVDVHFIQPFINATLNVLQVQAQIACTMSPASLKSNYKIPYDVEIAGVLSIISDSFIGSIALCFPNETFRNVCEGLFGESYNSIDPQIEDAAAEMLNMIFGGAKAELNKEHNYGIQKALPTVIRAKSLSLKQYDTEATLVLPFKSDAGAFHIDIEIVKKI